MYTGKSLSNRADAEDLQDVAQTRATAAKLVRVTGSIFGCCGGVQQQSEIDHVKSIWIQRIRNHHIRTISVSLQSHRSNYLTIKVSSNHCHRPNLEVVHSRCVWAESKHKSGQIQIRGPTTRYRSIVNLHANSIQSHRTSRYDCVRFTKPELFKLRMSKKSCRADRYPVMGIFCGRFHR